MNVFVKWIFCDFGTFVTNTAVERIYKMFFFCKNDFSLLKDLAGHAVEAEQEPGKKKKGGGKTVDTLF